MAGLGNLEKTFKMREVRREERGCKLKRTRAKTQKFEDIMGSGFLHYSESNTPPRPFREVD